MMMNKLKILFAVLFLNITLFSQKHGNEWINYSQKYYTFKIIQSGFYKLDYSALRNSGVDVTQFKSANVQLFAKEREVPVYIHDKGDNQIDSGDYILFYATRNDGWIDSLLYDKPEDIGNPAVSLINDTLMYFFTWNNQNINKRFQYDTTTIFSNLTPSNYWLQKSIGSNASYYNESNGSNGQLSSLYKPGEGWTFNVDGVKSNQSFDMGLVNTDLLYAGPDAPPAIFSFKNTSHSNSSFTEKGNHHFRISLKKSNEILIDTIFSGYKLINSLISLPAQKLINNGVFNYSIINDQGALTDFQGLGYIEQKVPQITSLNGSNNGVFSIFNSKINSKIRLSVKNHTIQNPFAFVFGDQLKYIAPAVNGTNLEFVISNSLLNTEQQFYIGDLSKVKNVSVVTPVNITGYFTNYSKISSEQAILMIYPLSLQSSAVNYASYRTSKEGGSHNVVFAAVDELYLQYGGGVPKHFMAIRRFAKQMYEQSLNKPKGLFLVGKAIANSAMKYNGGVYAQNLVPVFGSPSSDVAYTANFNGNMVPLIPTGRITVLSNPELETYLMKVQEFEKQQDLSSVYNTETKDWQKHILHFAGGSTSYQQSSYQSYLADMESIVKEKYFGGYVTTVKKQTSSPIDPILLKKVTKRIEDGVSVMNFFGHSNAATFDVGIDDPENWNNKGKYPFVIGNGCNSGDVYSTQESFSHRLLSIPNAGGIAFLSPSSLGYDYYMNKYTTAVYKQFSYENYGGTIGEHIKLAIKDIYSSVINELDESTCFSMSLNGDPMLKINSHQYPEFEISNQSVSFTPKKIDFSTDSLTLNIAIKNLGKAITDTFQIEVTRKFPKYNTDSIYFSSIYGIKYLDTIKFKFPVQSNISKGQNQFDVRIDIPSYVKEQFDEFDNNQVITTVNIAIDGIKPIYPYDFAIVPRDSVVLKASTTDATSKKMRYRFEIDTTKYFNSEFVKYSIKEGVGGLYEVGVNDWLSKSNSQKDRLQCLDSTVYFWRVSTDTLPYKWSQFSFEYLKNKEGWGQSNKKQFYENQFTKIFLDTNTNYRVFDTLYKELDVTFYDRPSALSQYQETMFRLNKETQDYGACYMVPSLHVVVIDPITLTPWRTHFKNENPQNSFGNFNDVGGCIQRSQAYFVFRQNDQTALKNFEKMISQHVPDGHYLFVYTIGTAEYDNWSNLNPSIFSLFKNLGSDSIYSGRKNNGFLFFCKKGDKSSVKEVIAKDYEKIFFKTNLFSFDNKGTELSPYIGGASKWNQLYVKLKPKESNSEDSSFLIIEEYNQLLNKIGEKSAYINFEDSIINLKNILNSSTRYIRLKNNYIDNKLKTPSDLVSWRVLYNEIPEAAVIPNLSSYWSAKNDTVFNGEKVKFSTGIKNVSKVPMDSLLVSYKLITSAGKIVDIPYKRQDSLRINQILVDTLEFNTLGNIGENTLLMEFNPYINYQMQDQPEQYFFNNIYQKNFYVKSDVQNPLLDVTFNGKHIMNEDLIAAKSLIQISLKDENEFDIMDNDSDTSNFWVYITDPKGKLQRIPFVDQKGKQILKWTPANSTNRKFYIEYPTNFTESGIYTLQVQGSDRSGNLSGKMEYKIRFEVQLEEAVSNLINYPNPFTTSTRFLYTLTGNDELNDYKIEIYSLTGKLVKELTSKDLGDLNVGRNQLTSLSWDGKDEFGDQLANGVYLYRLVLNKSKRDIKHIQNATDNYFKHDFGKMYLMR